MKYIDVSEHQGVIDWALAGPAVDGVIIRAGYGSKPDKYFARNAAECNRLGIPCGAYWFSYAKNPEDAKKEALRLLDAVKPYRMELPLAFDFEYDSVTNAKKLGVTVTKDLATKMVYAFCETVEKAGYWCLNYANPDFLAKYFSADVPMRFGLWLAAWPKNVDVKNPPRACAIWQWGGSEVPGITPGHTVDTNESYTDFRTLIAANGMNNLGFDDGEGGTIYEHAQPKPEPEKPWYADAMAWMQKEGLFTDGRPKDNLTRAELATVLMRYDALQDARDKALLATIEKILAVYFPEENKKDSGLLSD